MFTPYTQHRKLLTTAPASSADEEDDVDDAPPELPTAHLLAYNLVLYCASPQRPLEEGQEEEAPFEGRCVNSFSRELLQYAQTTGTDTPAFPPLAAAASRKHR